MPKFKRGDRVSAIGDRRYRNGRVVSASVSGTSYHVKWNRWPWYAWYSEWELK